MAIHYPTVKIIADVHSRVHFCRKGAIVQLKGGQDRLICRNNGLKDRYDLYLEENLLLNAWIPAISTLTAILKAGYGNGVLDEGSIQNANDQVNQPFVDISTAIHRTAPLMGLMASGLYLLADCELYPVLRSEHHTTHLLNGTVFQGEAKFTTSMGGENFDAPLYFIPSQRADLLSPERIQHYIEQMERSEYHCPRAIALYLNGSVSLLLDGHHKAAAAAALGKRLRTLMIFPLQDEKAVSKAIQAEKKLELYHGRWNVRADCPEKYGKPLYLSDQHRNIITRVKVLEQYAPRNEEILSPELPAWGQVPSEFCENLDRYPTKQQLMKATAIPPDRVKTVIRQLMDTPWPLPQNSWDICSEDPVLTQWREQVVQLSCFVEIFPESPMLTERQKQWLKRARNRIRGVFGHD